MKQTVYTASPESQQIHVWSLEADGKLTLVQVVDAPGQVQPMVVSPNKEFLYVGVRPEFRVLAYRITPDNGALTFAGEAALPGSPTHISTDRHGRFVFSASYNQGCVSVTPLHDGLPGETITVVEGLEGCHSANISPAESHPVGAGAEAGSHLPVYPQRRWFPLGTGARGSDDRRGRRSASHGIPSQPAVWLLRQ